MGQYLGAIDSDILLLHFERKRYWAYTHLRVPCGDRQVRAPHRPRIVPEPSNPWRHNRDVQLQRDGRPGDGHFPGKYFSGIEGARIPDALEESRAARPESCALYYLDSDRDHGYVRPSVRINDATCREHDGRSHRDSCDSFVRIF